MCPVSPVQTSSYVGFSQVPCTQQPATHDMPSSHGSLSVRVLSPSCSPGVLLKTQEMEAWRHRRLLETDLRACTRAEVEALQPSPVHSRPLLQPPLALSATAAPGPRNSRPQRWPCADEQPTVSHSRLMNSPGALVASCLQKQSQARPAATPYIAYVQFCIPAVHHNLK